MVASDKELELRPSPLHQIRSPLAAALVGIDLLKRKIEDKESGDEEFVETLLLVEQKLRQLNGEVEKHRELLR